MNIPSRKEESNNGLRLKCQRHDDSDADELERNDGETGRMEDLESKSKEDTDPACDRPRGHQAMGPGTILGQYSHGLLWDWPRCAASSYSSSCFSPSCP